MVARHVKGCYQQNVSMYFLVCEDLSNDDVGGSRDTIFQEIRPGAGFETGDFVKEKLRKGATVGRLLCVVAPFLCSRFEVVVFMLGTEIVK